MNNETAPLIKAINDSIVEFDRIISKREFELIDATIQASFYKNFFSKHYLPDLSFKTLRGLKKEFPNFVTKDISDNFSLSNRISTAFNPALKSSIVTKLQGKLSDSDDFNNHTDITDYGYIVESHKKQINYFSNERSLYTLILDSIEKMDSKDNLLNEEFQNLINAIRDPEIVKSFQNIISNIVSLDKASDLIEEPVIANVNVKSTYISRDSDCNDGLSP
jgi:hypothetical protein